MWGSVKEQHFDNSLQEIFSEDYLIIGKLFGMYGFANLILLWHNWDKLFMDFDRYIYMYLAVCWTPSQQTTIALF